MRILFYRFTADTIAVESHEIGFRKRYNFFFFVLSEDLRKILEGEVHNEELKSLCTSLHVIGVIKLRKLRSGYGQVECMKILLNRRA